MSLCHLIRKAKNTGLPWSRRTWKLSAEQGKAIETLIVIRHNIEHPLTTFCVLTETDILPILPIAASLTQQALAECAHHGECHEEDETDKIIKDITAICCQPTE